MKYKGTRQVSGAGVSLSAAIYQGMAADNGLFVPAELPRLNLAPEAAGGKFGTFAAFAPRVIAPFFAGDALETEVAAICTEAFSFPIPQSFVEPQRGFAELYHGPTLSFKDIGCRFLAACLRRIVAGQREPLTILTATSGDTGSAVASALHLSPGIHVALLYPDGRVTERQEKQITGYGGNVRAFAVAGAFDDCQALLKEAFVLGPKAGLRLSSANSVNIARLLPQMAYAYYLALRFVAATGEPPALIVPTGNVGNALGAVWAKAMGAPISRVSLASNANRTLRDFFATGQWQPRPSVRSLANAMDVGNPSNMERLFHLYPTREQLQSHMDCFAVADSEIEATIRRCFSDYGRVICPHTAVAETIRRRYYDEEPSLVYETAHPAKFEDVVEPLIGKRLEVPPRLERMLGGQKKGQPLAVSTEALLAELKAQVNQPIR